MMNAAERACAAYLAGDLDGVRRIYAQMAECLGIEDQIPASTAHDDTCYNGEATINETTITGI